MSVLARLVRTRPAVVGARSLIRGVATSTTPPNPAPAAAAPPPPPPPQPERTYGNLQDKDRIFTNLHGEWDPFLKGAMRRVCVDVVSLTWLT
jgi:hypothetical protein